MHINEALKRIEVDDDVPILHYILKHFRKYSGRCTCVSYSDFNGTFENAFKSKQNESTVK